MSSILTPLQQKFLNEFFRPEYGTLDRPYNVHNVFAYCNFDRRIFLCPTP